jgi:hypothetical protein
MSLLNAQAREAIERKQKAIVVLSANATGK